MRNVILTAALLLAAGATANAQTSLDQKTPGIVRGIQAQNSSGQNGELGIYRTSNQVVVTMNATNGKAEVVTIERGSSCGDAKRANVVSLGALHNGRLQVKAPMPLGRLLSGNYNLVVHNNDAMSQSVACGHIYLPT
jgi:hypothetical protein